jgi:tricorn protease
MKLGVEPVKKLVFLIVLSACASQAEPARSLAEPAVSSVRGEIAFVAGGDIWTVPLKGGEARLLVSHPAQESRPRWSPDGKKLAFVSERTGRGDIYVLTLETGELKRLTWGDETDLLDNWSADGNWIYFHRSRTVQLTDIFRVRAEGGTPMEVTADPWMTEFHAAPAPDGQRIAFAARGIAWTQWWRHGHSHLDESEIWVWTDGKYTRLVPLDAKNLWPMWAPDGKSLYYVSDRGGAENLWLLRDGRSRPITQFKDGRVLFASISEDGRTIAFERDFGLWSLDTRSGKAQEVPVQLRGAPSAPAVARVPVTGFSGLKISPDSKKAAFLGRGEIWAVSAKDGGDAFRVTRTAAPETSVEWAPDSKRLVYASERDGYANLFLYDFATKTEKRLTTAKENDVGAKWSPDGKSVAFVRGRKELRVADVESGQERLLAQGSLTMSSIAWSPDSKWIAYVPAGVRSFRNLWLASSDGKTEPQQISFLANVFSTEPVWAPDGKAIYFTTTQRTEDLRVARIDLKPHEPKYREDEFDKLFTEPKKDKEKETGKQESAPAKPVVEISWAGLRERLTMIDTGLDASGAAISSDSKYLLLDATVGGRNNLYLWPLDELSREPAVARQLTSTPGSKSAAQFSPDAKEVFYLERGRINAIGVENRQARTVNVTAELDRDFNVEKVEVFRQAWRTMRDNFYDPTFHGRDWSAVFAQWEPRIEGVQSPDEMRRVVSLMLGELNASHCGISAPSQEGTPVTGRLGVRFDRNEYESSGRLKISAVIPLSPASVAAIKPSEVLVSVEGVPIGPRTDLDQFLEAKNGKKVALEVEASDGKKRTVTVRPVNAAEEGRLRYRAWVEDRRKHVSELSGGRLGYVHMRDMSEESLRQLYMDLDTENQSKKGVVIDIRNNNGGFVNAYALDVFTRRPYMTMEQRGAPASPARTQLGQRALELPTILLTNQFSLSDAEDFTEGYRTLKLGKVVGEPTAGWIIYTGGAVLLDGSALRVPSTRITGADGKVMELNPRPVDIAVDRAVGEMESGSDRQLDAAVAALLKQVEEKR